MKFKCKLSKCEYEFLEEHDIKEMLNHPQYELVEEVKVEVKPSAIRQYAI